MLEELYTKDWGQSASPLSDGQGNPHTVTEKIQTFEANFDPQKSIDWQYERIGYLTSSKFFSYFYKAKGDVNWGNVIPILESRKTKENFEKNGWNRQAIIDQFYSKAEIKQFEWGHAFEPVAREMLGFPVDLCGFVKSDKYELFGGSPDGQMLYHRPKRVLEIKCPYGIGNFGLAKHFTISKDYKPEWYWQLMGNMYACNVEDALLCVFDPRLIDPSNPSQCRDDYMFLQEFHLSTADCNFIEKILKEITEFFNANYK